MVRADGGEDFGEVMKSPKLLRRIKIVEYWRSVEPRFVESPAFPACFACGFDGYDQWKSWATDQLEEAHIIAESIGGTREPGNLLLLCRRCHRDAPMTAAVWIMLDWVRKRQPYVEFMVTEASRATQLIGITEALLQRHPRLTRDEIIATCRELRIDSHPNIGKPNFDAVAYAARHCLNSITPCGV